MFKDVNGREWSTAITVTTVKRVKECVGVLLTDVDVIERIELDVMLFCDVLSAITQPQRDDRSVTADQFGELLAGNILDVAYESFRQDLIDFFPHSRRMIVQRIFQATKRLESERLRIVEERLTDEQIERLVAKALTQTNQQLDRHLEKLGSDSGKSPESSESIPPA